MNNLTCKEPTCTPSAGKKTPVKEPSQVKDTESQTFYHKQNAIGKHTFCERTNGCVSSEQEHKEL